MQDEHFLKAWAEGHTAFSAEFERSLNSLRTQCRTHLARLISWAIPIGILAGTAAAVIATLPVPAPHTQQAMPPHALVASYALPYPA